MYGELRLLYDSFQRPICLNLTLGQDKGSTVFMMCCLKSKAPLKEAKLVQLLVAFTPVRVNSSHLDCTGAQIAATLFLGLPLRVFLGESSVSINRLSEGVCSHQCQWAPSFMIQFPEGLSGTKKGMNFVSLLELKHPFSPALGRRGSWLLGLWTEAGT